MRNSVPVAWKAFEFCLITALNGHFVSGWAWLPLLIANIRVKRRVVIRETSSERGSDERGKEVATIFRQISARPRIL